ncbi:hypothetical protein Rhe02_69780 [Rhizocola hellebori]|uniref:Uncharacterized protein n=1 Tax=Rhizocola hellebori TaxID=1392758 RepID=A0A8J3QDW1_9ACTN|nr:actinodefensin-associated protein B [Rhizocola hellebori]GIH08911.1 hypothetical protein Rhe02_69780 [Rhizocola hellebori]
MTTPRLARHVTLTRLPYGGAVLVCSLTLRLAEYGETDADILGRLLADATAASDGERAARLTKHLLESGWLVFDQEPR